MLNRVKKISVVLLSICMMIITTGCSSMGIPEPTALLLKRNSTINLTNVTIATEIVTYNITPSGYNYESLQNAGIYNMVITFTYNVSYTKTYNVPLDIGYAGAPKYDVSILIDNSIGNVATALRISSGTKTFSARFTIEELKTKRIVLTVGSTNIQNKIHFKNMQVEYQCI